MTEYVHNLVHEDTSALICFACARRFPFLPQQIQKDIKNNQLLERHDQNGAEAAKFCGLTPKHTENIFGLTTYVERYGQMNEDMTYAHGVARVIYHSNGEISEGQF